MSTNACKKRCPQKDVKKKNMSTNRCKKRGCLQTDVKHWMSNRCKKEDVKEM